MGKTSGTGPCGCQEVRSKVLILAPDAPRQVSSPAMPLYYTICALEADDCNILHHLQYILRARCSRRCQLRTRIDLGNGYASCSISDRRLPLLDPSSGLFLFVIQVIAARKRAEVCWIKGGAWAGRRGRCLNGWLRSSRKLVCVWCVSALALCCLSLVWRARG